MAKINPTFPFDIYRFVSKPIRVLDKSDGNLFVERFLQGPQTIFEETYGRVKDLKDIINPLKTPDELLKYLKSHVGFTPELNNITDDISDDDLRKLITLAVALWKKKGIEPGYANILRLFTGKTAQIYNWFDFRFIIGENIFMEEMLGFDSWLISTPGVELSEPSSSVVLLLSFEDSVKDRTIFGNDGSIHGEYNFFNVGSTGFPAGSDRYLKLGNGVVTVPNSTEYDLSGNFTVEFFFLANVATGTGTIFKKEDGTGKGVRISINTAVNLLSFRLYDGTTTVTTQFFSAENFDDGTLRHIALVVDRVNGARLFLEGAEATTVQSVVGLGDLTNLGQIILGGSAVVANPIKCGLDNFRLSLSAVYAVGSFFAVPLSGFIEYQEELLDEYQTDIRIVDEGDLNKTLIQRIVNLMRPASERLNVIFTRFFDDFIDGLGQFIVTSGSVSVDTEDDAILQPSASLISDVLGDIDFTDIVLTVQAVDFGATPTTSYFSIVFFYQDALNYYFLKVFPTDNKLELFKKVAGVDTQLGSTESFVLAGEVDFTYTVMTEKDSFGDTFIRTFVDKNMIHEELDDAFEKGKFGFKTSAGIVLKIHNVEMFQLPIDIKRVGPGFDL